MKNAWLSRLTGTVEVEVRGTDAVRFVNQLTRKKILIQYMKRVDKKTILFEMQLKDVRLLREVARRSQVKIYFGERRGLPFFIKKLRTYQGLTFGVAAFIVIIFILSNIVWSIKIEGASIETEQKIRKELDKLDVKTGKFNFLTGNVDHVQKEITNKIPNVTWVGVEVRGSIYQLKVVEKKQPDHDADVFYSSIVAAKKAYIIEPYVESGQLVVKENQLVEKGDLLVSGQIGNSEKETTYAGAKGTILGETWYETKSEVPLKTTFTQLTGKGQNQYQLALFGGKMPIWGFSKPNYKKSQTESYTTYLHVWKWQLPIGITKKTTNEVTSSKRKLSLEEAEMLARDNARIDALKGMPYDAKIIKENVLKKEVTKDKLKMVVHFEVIENIAQGVMEE